MKTETTLEQRLTTYHETMALPNYLWANWVQVVHSSLINGVYHGDGLPEWVQDVYEELKTQKQTSFAD